jgi:predicted RNA methylase
LYGNIREEELKNKIAQDYFWLYDSTKIIGNIDFCISFHQNKNNTDAHTEQESLLWAEAKKGMSDIYNSLVQLILTIGKARTFDKQLPPTFLGAFDAEKIAFIPYNEIHDIFYINDFNWNVTPSNYETKEFKLVHQKVKHIIDAQSLLFNYKNDHKDLQRFIKTNFVVGKFGINKIKIDKNNFMVVYNKWLANVKPSIAVNWDIAKKNEIIDGDFYLADILSQENETLKDKLYVLLKKDHYELDRKLNDSGLFSTQSTGFIDNQKAHTQFWNKYDRPPKAEYWDYIVGRRDLLVPQDVRERKGSFFTPQIWVELSQKYIADVLGEDWQDEYYVWDCACGTGNLLAGLTNKYNIWASTLDTQDVDVIKDRIKNGANLLEDHVFQFDFLNDDFTKLPQGLQDIINDPKKRKKLVVYINPPYAEHGSRTTISAHGEHKTSVATKSKVYNDFNKIVGTATRELFAQFFLRIYKEIPDAKLASFSTLKFINSQNFLKFRQFFKAEFKKGFICKANTFDNVNGNFPICFLIWNLTNKQEITKVDTNVVLADNNQSTYTDEGIKSFYSFGAKDFISSWLRKFYDKTNDTIGYLILPGIDMQQQNGVYITLRPTESDVKQHKTAIITKNNLIIMSLYLAIRHCIEHTWINHNDQFLYPNNCWEIDTEFQNDCLTFSLFHNKNVVISNDGINNWIPFTEYEVGARDKFDSNFMTNFIAGKIGKTIISEPSLFDTTKTARNTPLKFSKEAKAVFNAGKKLWSYYHEQPKCNVNASLYDIREHFQGRNDAGKMNNKSQDEQYMKLISDLRENLKTLAKKIEPNVYEYGFLKA